MFLCKRKLEGLHCFQPTSQAFSPGRAQVPLPSGCWKHSNTHSRCHLMKCLATVQIEFQERKPYQHSIFITRNAKLKQLFLLLRGPVHLMVYMNQVFTISEIKGIKDILSAQVQLAFTGQWYSWLLHRQDTCCCVLSLLCCGQHAPTATQLLKKGVEMEQAKHTVSEIPKAT